MKYITTLLLLLLGVSSIKAQDWVTSTAIQGTDDIIIIAAKASPARNVYVFGHFLGTIANGTAFEKTSLGSRDYFVAKFNTDGDLVWLNQLGSPLAVYIYGGIGVDASDNVYITGGYRTSLKYSDTETVLASGGFDTFLAKYDTDGNPVFLKNLGAGGKNERPSSLRVDQGGNLIISGFFTDSIEFDAGLTLYSPDGVDDYFYGKFDPATGDRIWAKQIKGIDNTLSGRIFDIAATDDAYYLTGPYADSIGFEDDTIVSVNNSYDVHLIKTDLDGTIQWKRSIAGTTSENSWSVAKGSHDDIYVAGWYDSTSGLVIDSTDTETVNAAGSSGSDDLFIAKYNSAGTLQWIRTNGSVDTDKIFDIEVKDSTVNVCGYFSDELNWGSITLTTEGPSDQDMFTGTLSLDGEYRAASSTGGKTGEGSTEEARAIFANGDSLMTVIATNTTQLEIPDGTFYFNPSGKYFVAVGIIGCLPISIDNVFVTNVNDCFGNCTGSIQIVAGTSQPGYGPPYTYSIDNGETGSTNPFFPNLCAATDYKIVVTDSKGCSVVGPDKAITQPTELTVTAFDSTDVLCFGESTGTITVSASGGTGGKTFSIDGGTTYPFSSGGAANVAAGSYEVVVKDNNDCVDSLGTATILEPAELTIALDSAKDATCNGATGFIEMSAAGGVTPYDFTIDGTNTQPDSVFSPVAGSYIVKVIDANGCEKEGDAGVTIGEPDALSISLVSKDDKHGNDLGEIVVSATGETGDYIFSISPDAGTQSPAGTFIDLPVDDYVVEVEDSNCGTTASLSITQILGLSNLNILDGSIYPNPSNGMITLEFSSDQDEMELEIFSIDGRSVMSRQVFSTGGKVVETMDLSSLDKGIYMIRVDQQTLSNAIVLK